jgi:ABC-type transport system substrate-binding protein
MKRVLPVIIGFAALALLAWFAFRPSLHDDPSIRPVVIAFSNDIPSLDPARLQDAFALRAGYQIGDGLAKLDAENRIVPAVAERWESSDDFTRWTFHLREGVGFHPHTANGGESVPVTAADVAFSFERMLAADTVTAGPLSGVLEGAKAFQDGEADSVSGIRVVSPTVVEFSLSRPDSLFPGRISSPAYAIVNRAAAEAGGSEFGQTTHCSTGPFRFVARRGNEVILDRFEGYWGGFGEVPPERVIIRTVKEDAVALAEARAGRITIAYASPAMLQGLVERDGDGKFALTASASETFQGLTVPVFNTYFLAFNYPSVHPDLRRAIALAIDRDEVIAAAVPASGIPAAGPVPLACAGYEPLVQPSRDLDAARSALAAYREARPDTPPKLTILVHELAEAVPTGEVIQSQLAAVGIEVELVQRSFNAVLDAIRQGDFEATVLGFEYQYSEPQLILENFYTSATAPLPNVFHFKNPENDAAIANLLRQPHNAERLREAALVEKYLVEEAPGVFLYQTAQTFLIDPAISGVAANGSNYTDLTRASWKD